MEFFNAIQDTRGKVIGKGHRRVVDASGSALPCLSGVLLSQAKLVELGERSRWNGNNAAGSIPPSQVACRGDP